MTVEKVCYYRILGVAKDATIEQIKKAYRDLSKLHHPDRGGDAEVFGRIAEAYAILSDPDERAAFDRGEYKAKGPTAADMATQQLAAMFLGVVKSRMKTPEAARFFNPIQYLLDGCNGIEGNINASLTRLEKEIETSETILARLTEPEGEEVLTSLVQGAISDARDEIKSIPAQHQCLRIMREKLVARRYESESYHSLSARPSGLTMDDIVGRGGFRA